MFALKEICMPLLLLGEDYIIEMAWDGRMSRQTYLQIGIYYIMYIVIYRKNHQCKFDRFFFKTRPGACNPTTFFSGRLHLRCQKSGMQRSQLLRWGEVLSEWRWQHGFQACEPLGILMGGWNIMDNSDVASQLSEVEVTNGRELFQLFQLELSVVLSCTTPGQWAGQSTLRRSYLLSECILQFLRIWPTLWAKTSHVQKT